MKKKLIPTVILTTLALGVSGCSSAGTEPLADNATSKILTIANGTDIVSFDIHDHNTTSTEAVHVNMFNYLIKSDGNGGFTPDLAESWSNVDDKTWSFKLREGVTFHNGEDLTADDVKFTLERVAKDDTLLEYGSYKQIQEVVVKSDHEFDIVTTASEPALLNRLSRLGSAILPQDYIESEGWPVFLEEPVGSGPYEFKEWKKDDHLTISAFADYFGTPAKWDEVIFRSIPEDSTRISELLTGGVDIAVNIPPTDVDRIETTDGVTVVQSPTQRVMNLTLRTAGDGPTADPLVRQAIDLAIDKQLIVDSLLEGGGEVTRTRVTPGNTGANEDLFGNSLYDPDKARDLLDEAGYQDGLELTFSSPNGRYAKDKESAELMAAMLQEVGITANLEFLEWSAFNAKYQEHGFGDMFLIGYGNSMFDASLALVRLTKAQAAGESDYDNPIVEKMLVAAESNMDSAERAEQYQEAQALIADDRPQIYLYRLMSTYGVNERISFEPRLDEMFFVDDIILN